MKIEVAFLRTIVLYLKKNQQYWQFCPRRHLRWLMENHMALGAISHGASLQILGVGAISFG